MGLVTCPSCGRTISDHVDICPGCGYQPEGRNFYPGKPKLTAIPVRCSWCGEMVPAGEKSCPGCGSPAKVSYSMTPRRLRPVNLDGVLPSTDESEYDDEYDYDFDYEEKRRAPAWLLILLAVLFTALLAFAIMRIDAAVREKAPPFIPEPTAVPSTATTDA